MNTLNEKIKKYLSPPGAGVYSVHTGDADRKKLWKILYNTTNLREAQAAWAKNANPKTLKKSTSRAVILGIPSDNGAGLIRGSNQGPLFLRRESAPLPCPDLGDVRVIPHLLHDKYLNRKTILKARSFLYKNEEEKLPVSPLSITEDFCSTFYKHFLESDQKKGIMGIGGDHSISYPLIKSFIRSRKKQERKKIAVIHFDAHTDLLEERMGIDLNFSTWARHVIGELNSPGQLVQLGLRSSNKSKRFWESKLKVKQFWSREIHTLGIHAIAERIIRHLKRLEVGELYVTFDMDALDINYCAATGTPEPDGLSPHVPIVILRKLAAHFTIGAADIVELAPLIKNPNTNHAEPETSLMSASAICSCLIELINGTG